VVPEYANGAHSLRLFGSASTPMLQVVPTLTAYDVNDRVILYGSGLIEGNGSYQFAGATVVDAADDPNNLDVYYSTGNSFQNGSVYINRTVLPTSGLGAVSVTTAGGTSAPLDLNFVRVTVPGTTLGDVAVDADGKLWISDYTNPGQLLRIEPGSGATLATIDYTAAFGTTYSYNYAGLQVLDAAMTLGSTNVPAGSLLMFNGYANTDRVIALNPATGQVLATLSFAGNHDLTAGLFDATSGKFFILEANGPGNRMLQINPATGALEAAITVPLTVNSHAGLAISPVSGNLWIGSYNSTTVVEITRTGTEVRRVDLASQGVNQNEISGLAFLPDGRLLVASTQGEVFRVSLP
jgi:large repetitive protein